MSEDGSKITAIGGVDDQPKRPGYLAYAPKAGVLYACDERKTDGRGPIKPASNVSSWKVDQKTGQLTYMNQQPSLGAMPASVTVDPEEKRLFTANHAFFEHVVKVVETGAGKWVEKFEYDDSTIVQYGLDRRRFHHRGAGRACAQRSWRRSVRLPAGRRPRAGQPSCASGSHRPVGQVPGGVREGRRPRLRVPHGGKKLEIASVYRVPAGHRSRHCAFDKNTSRMFMTCEFSSELWSFDFDAATGVLKFIDKQSTLSGFTGRNEPATVQVHPNGKFVYMNNRGEDTIVWFSISADGHLTKAGSVKVSKSDDPAGATRCMTMAPYGAFLDGPGSPGGCDPHVRGGRERRKSEGSDRSPGSESGVCSVRRALNTRPCCRRPLVGAGGT